MAGFARPKQTVDRAELQAVLLVVTNLEIGGAVDFFTDSKITYDTFNMGLGRARFASSADIWVQLFNHIEIKGLIVNPSWMPSHADIDPKKLKIAPWHVAGNKCADVLAGRAAASHAIPELKAKPIVN